MLGVDREVRMSKPGEERVDDGRLLRPPCCCCDEPPSSGSLMPNLLAVDVVVRTNNQEEEEEAECTPQAQHVQAALSEAKATGGGGLERGGWRLGVGVVHWAGACHVADSCEVAR